MGNSRVVPYVESFFPPKSFPKNIPTIRIETPTLFLFPSKKLLNKLLPPNCLIQKMWGVRGLGESKFGVAIDSFCRKSSKL